MVRDLVGITAEVSSSCFIRSTPNIIFQCDEFVAVTETTPYICGYPQCRCDEMLIKLINLRKSSINK